MKDPVYKLSVCTPAYNAADRIPELYKSLLQQTEKRFEWIVVDDGSSDDTAAQVRAIVEDSASDTTTDTDTDTDTESSNSKDDKETDNKETDNKETKVPFPVKLLSQKR